MIQGFIPYLKGVGVLWVAFWSMAACLGFGDVQFRILEVYRYLEGRGDLVSNIDL